MKHIFAIYCASLTHIISENKGNTFALSDKDLWHRAVRVLRLRAGESCLLFDGEIRVHVAILEQTFQEKKRVWLTVTNIEACEPLEPFINLFVGLTKRDAFESICYSAAQMGVMSIQPVISEKVQREWGGEKERTRLTTIMIGACEQAKQFVVPIISEPVTLDCVDDPLHKVKILFDDQGAPFKELAQRLLVSAMPPLALMVGPEGGFTERETNTLIDKGFVSYGLTPTILRACDAVTVGLGIIRSL